MKTIKKCGAFIFAFLILFFGVSAPRVYAAEIKLDKKELAYFESVKNKNASTYPRVALYLAGKELSESAYLINDTTYVPFRAVGNIIGAKIEYDSKNRVATATMNGLTVSAADNSYIVTANERPLLSKTPAVILSDGRMYAPIRSIAKALSLAVEWVPGRTVKLSGTPTPLTHASAYYRSDDLYWLSKIISAESRGEPLLGQIAVGNVVLNRMRHRDYPNTIYGVIFDKKYGVQFSPVIDGSIYSSPTYTATVAAKICLEGISLSPDTLFFLHPEKSTSSWIPANRKYAFTVENHWFFY